MRAMGALTCLIVLAGMGAAGLAAGVAAPATSGIACSGGAVAGVIGGRHACLRPGMRCQRRYASQYRRYGFACVNGKLRKATKPKPTPTPTPNPIPPAPPIPNGPATSTLALPAAAPLPPSAFTIAVPDVRESNPDQTLVATGDAVWTASGPFRIAAADNAVSGPFAHGTSQDVGVGEGAVWVSDFDTNRVTRLDPATGKTVAVVQLPYGSGPEGISVTPGAVWVAAHHTGLLVRIDPSTNKVVANVAVTPPGSGGPQETAVGFGSVWASVPNINAVVRVDPVTSKVTFIPFPLTMSPCGGIAVGTSAVWVTNCHDGTRVARIDPVSNTIASIMEVGGKVMQPAADGDTVWFVASGDPDSSPSAHGYLIQLRSDDTVARRIDLGAGFIAGGAVIAFGSVWISDFDHPRAMRVQDRG